MMVAGCLNEKMKYVADITNGRILTTNTMLLFKTGAKMRLYCD